MNDNNDNAMFYFYLSLLANICQIASFDMNIQQTSTDEIMESVQKQGEVIQNDINDKLNTIIKQNNDIIELLKGEKI